MIEVDIEKRVRTYGGHSLIKVNRSFESNCVTQILGPSGIGKTTLLRILAGLIIPEKGKVTVNGEIWFDRAKGINKTPQERNIGFVFQDYALFPNMTVEQHLLFGTSDLQYVQRLLDLVQLQNYRKHKPYHLSGGQQQRLAIIRAMTIRPAVILMDEPFSALDATLKSEVSAHIKALIKELNATTLVVTHHPSETEGFADSTFQMG